MQCPHCFDNLIEEFGAILHEWESKVKEFARCLTCGHEGHSPKFFDENTFDRKTCPDEDKK